MLRCGVDHAALARAAGVDSKTVSRWVHGRVPHRRTRQVIAASLGEDESVLWPAVRPDIAPGASCTSEVVGAWAHRSDVPTSLWAGLLANATQRVDLLGYAFPFLLEVSPQAVPDLADRCRAGLTARIAVADPDCAHVAERDSLEQLGGTLPGRIRLALLWLDGLSGIDTARVGLHSVHLYNSVFRFDDQMIVTPHVFRGHGYQHPTLLLRRLSPHGIFDTFAEQFQQIWDTTRSVVPA